MIPVLQCYPVILENDGNYSPPRLSRELAERQGLT
jgi:hypothetical protein